MINISFNWRLLLLSIPCWALIPFSNFFEWERVAYLFAGVGSLWIVNHLKNRAVMPALFLIAMIVISAGNGQSFLVIGAEAFLAVVFIFFLVSPSLFRSGLDPSETAFKSESEHSPQPESVNDINDLHQSEVSPVRTDGFDGKYNYGYIKMCLKKVRSGRLSEPLTDDCLDALLRQLGHYHEGDPAKASNVISDLKLIGAGVGNGRMRDAFVRSQSVCVGVGANGKKEYTFCRASRDNVELEGVMLG